jgi:hypothetical protein
MVGRAPMVPRAPSMSHVAPRVPVRGPFVGGFHQPFFVHQNNFHHHHHGVFITSFGWPYRYGYYPGYYPYYPLFGDTSQGAYEGSNTAANEQNYQLQQELNRLGDEVQRLREEEAERSAPQPSLPQPPPQQGQMIPSSPTTFVFRDGRTQRVYNYAIAGRTLWVFNEQRATKIPLAELDIPATEKANEENGVRFQVPLQPR